MVRMRLEIKAELDGVTDLKPSTDSFDYFFKVTCTSCREEHPKLVSLNRIEEYNLGSGHGTANFIWRCSVCNRENSAKFDKSPVSPYTADHSGSFFPIVVVECRGLEFISFDPRGTWVCKSTNSNAIFHEVEFEDGEWIDYDEKPALPVRIIFQDSRFTRA